jgi:hypothetical protein
MGVSRLQHEQKRRSSQQPTKQLHTQVPTKQLHTQECTKHLHTTTTSTHYNSYKLERLSPQEHFVPRQTEERIKSTTTSYTH